MVEVKVMWGPGGQLLVGVPPEYEPLNLLLQLELQHDPDWLASLIRVAGDPAVDSYQVGGDVYWVSISGSRVTVDNEHDGRAATMDRDEFRDALVQFQQALANPPPQPARDRPPWRPPS
jgi:hypothetical protein